MPRGGTEWIIASCNVLRTERQAQGRLRHGSATHGNNCAMTRRQDRVADGSPSTAVRTVRVRQRASPLRARSPRPRSFRDLAAGEADLLDVEPLLDLAQHRVV